MSCGHMDTQVRLESGWNEIGEKMIGEEDDYGNGDAGDAGTRTVGSKCDGEMTGDAKDRFTMNMKG